MSAVAASGDAVNRPLSPPRHRHHRRRLRPDPDRGIVPRRRLRARLRRAAAAPRLAPVRGRRAHGRLGQVGGVHPPLAATVVTVLIARRGAPSGACARTACWSGIARHDRSCRPSRARRATVGRARGRARRRPPRRRDAAPRPALRPPSRRQQPAPPARGGAGCAPWVRDPGRCWRSVAGGYVAGTEYHGVVDQPLVSAHEACGTALETNRSRAATARARSRSDSRGSPTSSSSTGRSCT